MKKILVIFLFLLLFAVCFAGCKTSTIKSTDEHSDGSVVISADDIYGSDGTSDSVNGNESKSAYTDQSEKSASSSAKGWTDYH